MANIKSQIKRNKQAEVRKTRNKGVRSQLKTLIAKFRSAAEAGDQATAESTFKAAAKALDKAAGNNVIHKHAAGNKKSAMAKWLNQL